MAICRVSGVIGTGRLLVAILLGVLACHRTPAAQGPTFSTRVESVRLDALITEDGRPLTRLTAMDFDVLDNNVRQSIDFVSLDQLPVNVVCVLDLSVSVSGNVLEQLRAATNGIAGSLRTGDQVALLTFNHRVTLGLPLTSDVSAFSPALARIQPGGGTALIDAAYASLWVADADPGRTVIILFSDGLDTASWLTRDRVVDAAKRSDATVYAVTTGGRRNEFLVDLTDTSGGRVFSASSPERLKTTFDAILQEFRQRYVISYTPHGVATAGWHKVDLHVKGRRASIKVRAGYLAGPG